MAIDLYYTAGASVLLGANDFDALHLGLTHNLGIAYRLSVLSVGLDFNFGNIKDMDAGEISVGDEDLYRLRTTHLRLFVGVKI